VNTEEELDWWLGETFDQEMRDKQLTTGTLVGVIAGVQLDTTNNYSPANMLGQASREAEAGWFIGQDQGTAADFNPVSSTKKLFRLIGRGHGEWLNRNCKVSIENIRASTSAATDFGTFSVVIRNLHDTDNNQQVMERFDNCSLDCNSTNYVGRKIGTQYQSWDTSGTTAQLKLLGKYPNRSKFVYVNESSALKSGLDRKTLLPFGYYGPPKFTNVTNMTITTGSDAGTTLTSFYVHLGTNGIWPTTAALSSGLAGLTASLNFPSVRLRLSASDGGLTDRTQASFGMQTTTTASSTITDKSVAFVHRLWTPQVPADAVAGSETGQDAFSYVFTMDNIVSSSTGDYFYRSGSRTAETSKTAQSGQTYKDLLNAGYDSFTAPFCNAFDGFNIRLPDPVWNGGMSSTSEESTNSIYHTWKRAIDTVASAEAVDMNLLVCPGLTLDKLTTAMISTCENRADTLALIDLQNVYLPWQEGQYSTRTTDASRSATTPIQAGDSLSDRKLNSSYGATFYPWVQVRDDNTGQLVWCPPSVAMAGVLASSEKKSAVWFAPAGFNRGGLTDGAAGIPIVGVTERLTSTDRDRLYENNINPIASFPSTGIVVFGQKTLQASQTALDRINVRRMVIYLKKQISILSTQILFEQNVPATWARFKALVEPFLENVKSQYGISAYKLILDETTTTESLIDQNIMYAKIMVKPARAIEFIAIDFVIASTGASFDD
jgi:hypothetical protein